ncbi:MAG: hypothetical protein D6800_08325 [Candidatus Zixiibacteriota bacterium]|nr:MAG: hypothetical protein D6800_08325 [candidate division Zixibacteria bacterium]
MVTLQGMMNKGARRMLHRATRRSAMQTSLFVALMLSTAIAANTYAASVPELINYQGELLDAGGQPVNGVKNITFTIYDDAVSGTAQWTETQSVTVSGGRFNVLLGSVNPVSASVFSGPDRFLGVRVEGDPEMTPRSRVGSVAYALSAGAVGDKSEGAIVGARGTAMPTTRLTSLPPSCTLLTTVPAGKVLYITDYYIDVLTSSPFYNSIKLYDDPSCGLANLLAELYGPLYQDPVRFVPQQQLKGPGLPIVGPRNIYVIRPTNGESSITYALASYDSNRVMPFRARLFLNEQVDVPPGKQLFIQGFLLSPASLINMVDDLRYIDIFDDSGWVARLKPGMGAPFGVATNLGIVVPGGRHVSFSADGQLARVTVYGEIR